MRRIEYMYINYHAFYCTEIDVHVQTPLPLNLPKYFMPARASDMTLWLPVEPKRVRVRVITLYSDD